jgi:hypothetical protein
MQIKLSKELEHVLATGWNAEGKGLHERLNVIQASGQPVPDQLVSVASVHVDRLWKCTIVRRVFGVDRKRRYAMWQQ